MRGKIQGREEETSLPSESGHPRKNLYNCKKRNEEYDEGDFWNYPVLFDLEDEEEYGGCWGYGNNGISRLYIR